MCTDSKSFLIRDTERERFICNNEDTRPQYKTVKRKVNIFYVCTHTLYNLQYRFKINVNIVARLLPASSNNNDDSYSAVPQPESRQSQTIRRHTRIAHSAIDRFVVNKHACPTHTPAVIYCGRGPRCRQMRI